MHISTPLISGSVQASSINSPTLGSKKRIYDWQSNGFPRKPLHKVCSRIRSAWGDVREFIGVPSEIRRIRNALPPAPGLADHAAIKKLMVHLRVTGEQTLYRQVKQLDISMLKQWIEKNNAHIATLDRSMNFYNDQVTKFAQAIETLKQNTPPEEVNLPTTKEIAIKEGMLRLAKENSLNWNNEKQARVDLNAKIQQQLDEIQADPDDPA